MPPQFRGWLLWTGIVFGFLTGGLTLLAGAITTLSGHLFIAALQAVLLCFIFPGLYASAIIGSLVPGALVNLVLYSFLGGLCCLIFRKKIAPPLYKEDS